MGRDLFAAPTNGHSYLTPLEDPFRYICGVFSGNGAIQILQRANSIPLVTFYPIRFTRQGEPTPLFRSYLFLEFREGISINLCRTTSRFIKIISERDENGVAHPVLVGKESLRENMAMVMAGRYNDRIIDRRFYGRGSIVRVLDGHFIDQKVRLEIDILPEMKGNYRVPVDINGIRAKIEIYKLAI
jgi:hypothetical protein